MLRKRSPQRGLFEADTMYLDFVGRNTFYAFLAAHRAEVFRDEPYAQFYSPNMGRPSVPPSLLATALVLQKFDEVSDREAARRAAYDLQWKVALGVELDARPFQKSVLQEFRAQLVVHEQQEAIFKESLAFAKRQGYFKGTGEAEDRPGHYAHLGPRGSERYLQSPRGWHRAGGGATGQAR